MEASAVVKPSLRELRELVGAIDGSHPKEVLRFSAFEAGFPHGAVVEVAGGGKTELVAQFLKEHPELRVAWLESELSVFPLALMQREVKLEKVLFIEAGEDFSWTALQILQSQVFNVVVLSHVNCDEKTLRKVQLAAEKSGVTILWLNPKLSELWVPSIKLEVSRLPYGQGLMVKTRRLKGVL